MKTIIRISLCVMLAFACFVTVGCSDSKTPDPAPSATSGDDGGSDAKPEAGSEPSIQEPSEVANIERLTSTPAPAVGHPVLGNRGEAPSHEGCHQAPPGTGSSRRSAQASQGQSNKAATGAVASVGLLAILRVLLRRPP